MFNPGEKVDNKRKELGITRRYVQKVTDEFNVSFERLGNR